MQTTIQNPGSIKKPKSKEAWYSIGFNVQFERSLTFNVCRSEIESLVKADMERALSERGILLPPEPDPSTKSGFKNRSLVLGQLNWFSGVFFVTDLTPGLSTLEGELKRIGWFAHCEIGWHWQAELIWRRHHPKTGADTFQPRLFQWEQVTQELTASLTAFLTCLPAVPASRIPPTA